MEKSFRRSKSPHNNSDFMMKIMKRKHGILKRAYINRGDISKTTAKIPTKLKKRKIKKLFKGTRLDDVEIDDLYDSDTSVSSLSDISLNDATSTDKEDEDICEENEENEKKDDEPVKENLKLQNISNTSQENNVIDFKSFLEDDDDSSGLSSLSDLEASINDGNTRISLSPVSQSSSKYQQNVPDGKSEYAGINRLQPNSDDYDLDEDELMEALDSNDEDDLDLLFSSDEEEGEVEEEFELNIVHEDETNEKFIELKEEEAIIEEFDSQFDDGNNHKIIEREEEVAIVEELDHLNESNSEEIDYLSNASSGGAQSPLLLDMGMSMDDAKKMLPRKRKNSDSFLSQLVDDGDDDDDDDDMILLDGNMILNLSPMSLKNHWNMDNIDDFHEMNYKSEKSTYDDNGLGNWPAYVDSSRSSIGDTDDYETEASDGDNKSNRSDLSLKIKPRNSLAQNGNTSEIKTSVETEGEDSEEADDSTDEESPTLPRPPIVSPTSKSTSSTSVLAKSTSISKNKSGIAKNNIASKTFSTSLVPSTNVTNYKIPTESLTNPPSISGPPRLASWVMNSKRPFGIIDGRTTSSIQSKCNESGNSKMKMVNGDVIDMSLKGYNPSVIRKAMRKALLSKNRHNETNFYNSESNNMSLDEFIHSQDDDETVGGTNINVDTTNNYNNQDDTTNTFIPQNRNIPLSAFRNRISGNNAAAAQQEGLNYGLGVLNNIPQSLYPIRKTGMWRNTVNKQSPIFKRNALHSDFQKRVFCTRPPSALRSSSSMGSLAPKRSKRTKAHTTSGMDTINGSANSTELAASVEAQSFSTKKQDEFEDNSFKFDKLETGSLDSLFDELG